MSEATEGGRVPLATLISRRKADFARTLKARVETEEITVRMEDSRPIGILHLGDPHLDDDGTDLALLETHLEYGKEEGVFVGCVGDITNNWRGGLARLHASQSATASDGWRLTEWLLDSVPRWAYLQRGNHDAWSTMDAGGDALGLLLRGRPIWATGPHECRIKLVFPGQRKQRGTAVRIWTRHSWPGRSIWHPTHGLLRAAKMGGYPADLLIGGHLHTWGLMSGERPGGQPWTAIQVGSYKRLDDFALSLGYPPTQHGQACLTIIDPNQVGPGRITTWWDIPTGITNLRHARKDR